MADISVVDGRHTYRLQALGRVFGWAVLATFLTSIPAYFIGYADPRLHDVSNGLVPRGLTYLGFVGGPALMITGILVAFNATERGGALQTLATLPEAAWELSLSFYCIVKGFRPSPVITGRDEPISTS